jgi:GTP cyclohydrolase I
MIRKIEEGIKTAFDSLFPTEGLEEDWIQNPNLKDTPARIAKMWLREFFPYNRNPVKVTTFPNKGYDEIIMFDHLPYIGKCSHHFLPFPGMAWFLYIPDKLIVGASKPKRILDYYCKEPQLQEQLGIQVMNKFMEEVKPVGAMLLMRAVHTCIACRGAETGMQSGMTTSITNGVFRQLDVKTEALQLILFSQGGKL